MHDWFHFAAAVILIACLIATATFCVLIEIEMRKISRLMKPRDKDQTS